MLMTTAAKPGQVPLIDGDIIVYRCGFAADAQAKNDLLGGVKVHGKEALEALAPLEYESWAMANTKSTLTYIRSEVFGADKHRLFLTGKGNFREQLATLKPYKGTRDPYQKPKYYQAIRDYMEDFWGAEVIDGMEADDKLGIEQCADTSGRTCIVSIDKDLDMIPGWHFNWVKNIHYHKTAAEADLMLLRQMLEGDTSDNIPGINRVGPKTVDGLMAKLGHNFDAVYKEVQTLYNKQYGETAVDSFNEVASLLWILRKEMEPCPFLWKG